VSSNKPIYWPRTCWLKTVLFGVRNMEALHLGISTFIVKPRKENPSAYQGGYVLRTAWVSSKKTTPCLN
jgi:hypothetical protein